MKRFLSVLFMLITTYSLFAQERIVTTFLGIPVDGTKSDMIQKLQAKGFKYYKTIDVFEGEFNGEKVHLSVLTHNNKVYRIALIDAIKRDETDIKIRFNKLCRQFGQNPKYLSISEEDITIPESEDISYEISANNKRYQASFIQTEETAKLQKEAMLQVKKKYSEEAFSKMTEKEQIILLAKEALNLIGKRQVWFMIGGRYGEYCIGLYYDNLYNQANGEDL
ncbi:MULTISPECIES: hypothetical protein [Bacteroidales]|uniref:hypothetical protein n=1 Tax=Bacteroides pyogenes TaxID=310300 RepID=UPI002F91E9A7